VHLVHLEREWAYGVGAFRNKSQHEEIKAHFNLVG